MTNRLRFISLALAVTLAAAACGDTEAAGPVIASDRDRAGAETTPEDLAGAAAGDRAFAIDLHRALAAGTDGNLVLSPVSVRLALAMAWAGARGATSDEMAAVLHLDLPADRMHAALNALDVAIESRNRSEVGPDGRPQKVEISIANALWGQEGMTFLEGFLNELALNYGAGMRLADYVGAPEEARRTINAWVADQTNDRIEELVAAGVLGASTRLVLTSAVYLDATWESTFNPDETREGGFTTLAGGEVTVDMMHQQGMFPYGAGDGWRAIDLPYAGGEVSILILVPDSGTMPALEARLDEGMVDGVLAALTPTEVRLGLPRFEFRTKVGMVDLLGSLGMSRAFDADLADFSGMTDEERIFIGDVIHEAFIAVDEEGTEAAAATAVIMAATGAPTEIVSLTVDRPFLFSLYDRETGAILFMGRVVDPSQAWGHGSQASGIRRLEGRTRGGSPGCFG